MTKESWISNFVLDIFYILRAPAASDFLLHRLSLLTDLLEQVYVFNTDW